MRRPRLCRPGPDTCRDGQLDAAAALIESAMTTKPISIASIEVEHSARNSITPGCPLWVISGRWSAHRGYPLLGAKADIEPPCVSEMRQPRLRPQSRKLTGELLVFCLRMNAIFAAGGFRRLSAVFAARRTQTCANAVSSAYRPFCRSGSVCSSSENVLSRRSTRLS
jgi:hypothetical protein